jgi:hypothetical protein
VKEYPHWATRMSDRPTKKTDILRLYFHVFCGLKKKKKEKKEKENVEEEKKKKGSWNPH